MTPNRTTSLIASSALAAATLLAVSCSTPAHYVESGGTQTVVSLNQINIQDFMNAADKMVNSLLSSGVLAKAPHQPAFMAMSNIVNNTTQQMDINLLTKKIRVALSQSGKVQTLTTVGVGGTAEDTVARGTKLEKEFMSDTPGTATLPDYTLSGRIIEDKARAGDVRQVSYIFQLSLTDTKTGAAVWESEQTITKQGERSSVGW